MKLQRIRYFVTLSETLSFSRTAEIHCVSQTTVSQQIKLLERELGRDLLTRTKRHVELTPAGRLYLQDARRALNLLDSAEEKVRLLSDEERTPLRMCVIHGISPGFIVGTLGAFTKTFPEIALKCSYCPGNELPARISAGSEDVGVTFDIARDFGGADQHSRHLASDELMRVRQYVVTSARNPLAGNASLSRDQLVGETFVNAITSSDAIPFSSDSSITEAAAERSTSLGATDRKGDSPEATGHEITDPEDTGPENAGSAPEASHSTLKTSIMVDSMDTLLLTLSLGTGYTLLSEPLTRTLPESLGLVTIPLAEDPLPILAVHREDASNEAIARFVDFARQHPFG